MRYYLIEISDGDAKIKGKGMYEYATRDEAEAMFHQKIGTAMRSELYAEHRIALMNDTMFPEMSHVFLRPTEVETQIESAES